MFLFLSDQNIPRRYFLSWALLSLCFFSVIFYQIRYLEKRVLLTNWNDFDFYEWKEIAKAPVSMIKDLDEEQLLMMSGMGLHSVDRVICYRQKNGIFWQSDLDEISGINRDQISLLKKNCY